MSLFKNLFGGKKEDPKPFSRTPLDLDQGYIFEYDMQSWEVMAVYEYDWGDEDFSKEFKVSDGQNTYYLSVEEDDEIEMTWSKKSLYVPLKARSRNRLKKMSARRKPSFTNRAPII